MAAPATSARWFALLPVLLLVLVALVGLAPMRAAANTVYAAGIFSWTLPSGTASQVAMYNEPTKTWSVMGSSVVTDAESFVVPNATYAVVGGAFGTAGGVAANNMAYWNGAAWGPIGTGISGASVRTLVMYQNKIAVVGIFTSCCGTAVNNVGLISGTTCSALGTGTNGQIRGAFANGTFLYVGGLFTTAGGVTANYVAKWNGTAWSALGSGTATGSGVYGFEMSGSTLYVAGQFTVMGGVSAQNIAAWNGATWSALGTGVNNIARQVMWYNGLLYVGGTLTTAGGVSAVGGIAYWNGTQWFGNTGNFTSGYVLAFTVSGKNLYAGGSSFIINGTGASSSMAVFDGTTWKVNGSVFVGEVRGLYTLCDAYSYGTGCTSCIAGYYMTTLGCVQCPTGTYNDLAGRNTCLSCPLRSASLTNGSTSINSCVCQPGSYGPPGAACTSTRLGAREGRLGDVDNA